MTVTEKIRKRLYKIMSPGNAYACYIDKGYHYNGDKESTGWYYVPFGGTPVSLGKNWQESREILDQIIEEKEYYIVS